MNNPRNDGGGGQVFDHSDAQPKEGGIVHGNQETIDAITAHVTRWVGEIDTVFHEAVSPLVHLDVHHVPPNTSRPFHFLVTSGMSDLPMTIPTEYADQLANFRFAEFCIMLPPDWPMTQEAFRDDRYYWPVRLLKMLARFPHEYETFFAPEHTLGGASDDPVFHESVGFNGLLVFPPIGLADEFASMERADGAKVNFYSYIPLYPEEMTVKRDRGLDALFALFDKHGLSPVLDPQRKNCAKPKRFFGFR